MAEKEDEIKLRLACAKLELLIALGKAQPTQDTIDREWVIMSLTSSQKRARR
jgi:hypothetical protein